MSSTQKLDCERAINSTTMLYTEMASILNRARSVISDKNATDGEIVDVAYAIRQLRDAAEKVRKDCNKLHELAAQVLGIRVVAQAQAGLKEAGEPKRGKLATGSIDVSIVPMVPDRGSPEYRVLLEHLGFTGPALDDKLVQVHWPGLRDYFSRLAVEGAPMPPGVELNKTYTIYSLALRPRRRK